MPKTEPADADEPSTTDVPHALHRSDKPNGCRRTAAPHARQAGAPDGNRTGRDAADGVEPVGNALSSDVAARRRLRAGVT